MNTDAAFIVRAECLVPLDEIDEEDQEVEGDHTIDVPPECREWPEEKLAGWILDRFHDSVPVGELENFSFTVYSPEGEELSEG